MVKENQQEWFPLRQDIRLLNDSYNWSGKQSYKILDPANNSFYHLGAIEFEILKMWDLKEPKEVVNRVNESSIYHITESDVKMVFNFLKENGLLILSGSEQAKIFSNLSHKSNSNLFSRLSKNYLFLRIPLIRPDAAITIFHQALHKFFTTKVLFIILIMISLGIISLLREFESYTGYFSHLKTAKGAFYAIIALIISKIIHELAHATVVKHFGCKIYYMGISFVLFLPMLWTDASDSWRLKSKYQRMIISGAGMAAELLLAGFSLLCWSLLPEGELKFIMFVLSGVTLISTILINLNPFMKFDGYYLLSDLVQTPNLQTRSITATLELIRKFLWGFSAEYVEELSSPTRKWFVLYGMSCLVYRLLLYVSIAIIVYNFAPSPYGLLLALLEVYWLIIFPVIKELKYIFSNRKVWIHSFSFKISLFIIMTAVVLILPTGNNISGVAIVRSAEEVTLSVSRSVKLVKSNIINFKEVKQGDLLYEFYSPELYQEQEELQARGQRLNNEYEHYITSSDQKNKAYFIKEEILGVISSLRNNYQEQQSLNILSPINGVVRDIPATLKNGDWLESKEFLGSVLGGGNIVEAFVSEYDVERINVGDQAVFYPNGTGYKPIKVVVEKISKNSVRNLPYPSLAAAYGGVIEVNNNSESHELKESLFKITLKPIKDYNINSFIIGDVVIKGNYQSWFSYIFIKAYSFILRELSF